ncbi:unnamed protein product [Fraxinus pennsylvanica]|uniref:Uncharacterized protein n=1 Tax=Fraxinus pennsylvanica TaxID=56036 RepID=A0AAD1ZA25_9LAMI|nr:unnamed protein product [Fraxinus pennsylvanica]
MLDVVDGEAQHVECSKIQTPTDVLVVPSDTLAPVPEDFSFYDIYYKQVKLGKIVDNITIFFCIYGEMLDVVDGEAQHVECSKIQTPTDVVVAPSDTLAHVPEESYGFSTLLKIRLTLGFFGN